MGLEIIQILVGIVLVLLAGYSLLLIAFRKGDVDFAEKIVLIPILGLLVPSLILLFMNLAMRIPLSAFAAYATLIVVTTASLAYHLLVRKEGLFF